MALTLPAAPWRDRPGLDRIADALGAGEGHAAFVGGAVRDTLLGLPVADIDVATVHAPATVVERLTRNGMKAIPTGMAHGTVTAVADGTVVEVTTLRRDVSTDGRHALVAFTDDWREDAARRDFTINALYAGMLDGAVRDWFGGVEDLRAGRVRFIGDPLRRIAEDHLRILRYFRFLARFGDRPDAAALDACTARANDLMALSRERIADELLKLLVLPAAGPTLRLMTERGILLPVVPEVDERATERIDRLVAREQAAGVAPDPVRRLAALLPATVSDAVAARLKLSNAQRKRLRAALDGPPALPRTLAYRYGTETAIDRILLADDMDPVVAIDDVRSWDRPVFSLSGGMLVEMGVPRGPDVARLLRAVEEQWIAEGFPDGSRVPDLAKAAVDQWLRDTSRS